MKPKLDNILSIAINYVRSFRTKYYMAMHFAVVIKRGKCLAFATNKSGARHMGAGNSKCSLHAERAVLKKIGDISQLQGASLIVIRIHTIRDEMSQLRKVCIGNSKPCHECACHLKKCIQNYGLKSVYYSAERGEEINI